MSTALARLISRPRRYRFDAALRVLMAAARTPDPASAARFEAAAGTAYPGADIATLHSAGRRPPVVVTPVFGLTGPAGVLPRLYDELLATSARHRSRALRDFLDLVAQRFAAHFVSAGAKYRPSRIAEIGWLDAAATAERATRSDPLAEALLAFVGYATPHLADRVETGPAPLLHYAGLLSMRPRSADRLAALLSDWLGRPVEVLQFAGEWLALPPDQRTRLPLGRVPGRFNRLGADAAVGARVWDVQARIVLRVGPLDAPGFAAMLPDRDLLRRLVGLVRAFLGFETGFAVNPVLAAAAIPALRLGGEAGAAAARLGWNCWLPSARRRMDAADAVFAAEIVEAEAARSRPASREERR